MAGFMERFQNNNQQQQNNENNENNSNNENNQNQNENNQNQSNNDDNNNSNDNNNMDNNTSFWDNNSNNNENGEQNNNQQNQNNNQNDNQNQQSTSELFAQHIASLNLTDGIDLSKLQEEAQEGNFESINKAFETVSANTYKAALQQTNQLVDTKIASAIEKAVSESSSNINESMALKEMHSALPFAGDVNIAPVAEAAMKQFMSQGASVNEAVQKVEQFFKTTAEKVSGGSNNSQNSPGSNGYNPNNNVNDNNSNNSNSGDEDSWMDFLTNKS